MVLGQLKNALAQTLEEKSETVTVQCDECSYSREMRSDRYQWAVATHEDHDNFTVE